MIINLRYDHDKRVKWLTAHDSNGKMYWWSGNVQIKQDESQKWRVVVAGIMLPRKYTSSRNAKLGAGMMK